MRQASTEGRDRESSEVTRRTEPTSSWFAIAIAKLSQEFTSIQRGPHINENRSRSRTNRKHYFTVRVKVALCEAADEPESEVAVTVIV